MKAKHVLLNLTVLFLLIGVFAACSNTGNEGGEKTSEPGVAVTDEQVELRIAWWGGQTRHEKYHQIIENFEKKYPHIKVTKEFAEFGDYFNKLTTQTAGGNAPDVIHMHWARVSDYAKRGALLSLNDMIDSGQIDLQYFSPAVIDAGVIDGNNYMVALGNSISGVFYNKTLFDELNVEYPTLNWTWDEFFDTSIALKNAMNANDKWATNITGASTNVLRNYFRQQGKDFFTADGELAFNREDLIEYWTMWERLHEAEAIPDPATMVEFSGKQEEESLMALNRVAMVAGASNQMKIYQRSMPDSELDIVRIPTTPGGENGEYLEGAYLSIYAQSQHPNEAALFIDYMINSEEAIEIFQLEQGALGSSKMNDFVRPLLEAPGVKEIDFVSQVSDNARPVQADPVSGAQVMDIFALNYEALRFGQKTVEQAVDDFIAEAEKIMN